MQITNPAGRQYLSELKRRLKCSFKQKRGLVNVMTGELYNFELDNPNAAYSDYTDFFGAPKDAAQSCLNELSRSDRAAYWLPLAILLSAAAISIFAFLSALLFAQQYDRGFFVVSKVTEVSYSDIDIEYDISIDQGAKNL